MGDIYIVVCSTLARITIGWMKKLVDEVGSTVSKRNLCWVFATGGTITKVDLSEKLIIFHCRMSTIQPAWPVCTTSECWHTRCWHFCYCGSHKTISTLKELVVTQNWFRFWRFVTVLHESATKSKMIIVIRKMVNWFV